MSDLELFNSIVNDAIAKRAAKSISKQEAKGIIIGAGMVFEAKELLSELQVMVLVPNALKQL